MPESTREHLLALAKKRIYFGHQSVGANVLEGLSDLARQDRVELGVTLYTGPATLSQPGFLHAIIGQNESPMSKIDAFERAVDDGIGGHVDVALFKFCYVDFTGKTDVDAVFERYRDVMSGLEARHPGTKFAYITVPLTVTQQGMKGALKSLLGRSRWGEAENEARHRFSERLRREYGGKKPLFDLAELQATRADGSRELFLYEGREVPRLASEYSDDGQHLDANGRHYIARRFASFLAETVRG
jgi:hypothetical protein